MRFVSNVIYVHQRSLDKNCCSKSQYHETIKAKNVNPSNSLCFSAHSSNTFLTKYQSQTKETTNAL